MQLDISVLIIGDEESWVHQLIFDLSLFGFKIAGCIDNHDYGMQNISSIEFDIALLDINLNGKNSGVELGKIINNKAKKPFIFITGSSNNDNLIRKAISAKPSGFLNKPISPAALFVSIQSAIHYFYSDQHSLPTKNAATESHFFFVKQGSKYIRIDWQNVVCLRSEKNYTSIITRDRDTYLIRSSLQKTLLHIIPEKLKNDFVQINRAEILHICYIDEISADEAKTGYQSFNITDAYAKNLKQQLNIIL